MKQFVSKKARVPLNRSPSIVTAVDPINLDGITEQSKRESVLLENNEKSQPNIYGYSDLFTGEFLIKEGDTIDVNIEKNKGLSSENATQNTDLPGTSKTHSAVHLLQEGKKNLDDPSLSFAAGKQKKYSKKQNDEKFTSTFRKKNKKGQSSSESNEESTSKGFWNGWGRKFKSFFKGLGIGAAAATPLMGIVSAKNAFEEYKVFQSILKKLQRDLEILDKFLYIEYQLGHITKFQLEYLRDSFVIYNSRCIQISNLTNVNHNGIPLYQLIQMQTGIGDMKKVYRQDMYFMKTNLDNFYLLMKKTNNTIDMNNVDWQKFFEKLEEVRQFIKLQVENTEKNDSLIIAQAIKKLLPEGTVDESSFYNVEIFSVVMNEELLALTFDH